METKYSSSFLRREFTLRTLQLPTISIAEAELGRRLSKIVFGECAGALKEDFGLVPPLIGAGNTLWVSPSDLLIGKICLEPPFTVKQIKALAHEGILKIGREIEMKFWNEMEEAKQKALHEQEIYLRRMYDMQKERAINETRQEEKEQHKNEIERMTKLFEEYLREQIKVLELKMRHQEKFLRKENLYAEEIWKQRLQDEVEVVVRHITSKFLEELEVQRKDLEAHFNDLIVRLDNLRKHEQFQQELKFKDILRQLQHNLECKNFANMMYVLCLERRKCQYEKQEIVSYYESKIIFLCNSNVVKDKKIERLTADRDKRARQIETREEVLVAIIGQFQKFVNFALRAYPQQAEFLLSIEEMLDFGDKNENEIDRLNTSTKPSSCKMTSSVIRIGEFLNPDPLTDFIDGKYQREVFPTTDTEGLLNVMRTSLNFDSTSGVHFTAEPEHVRPPLHTCDLLSYKSMPSKKSLLKPSTTDIAIDTRAIGHAEKRKTLLAVTDSVELLRRTTILTKHSNSVETTGSGRVRQARVGERRSRLLDARDSVILPKMSLERSGITLVKRDSQPPTPELQTELPFAPSRLIAAVDSLEIIKSASKANLPSNSVEMTANEVQPSSIKKQFVGSFSATPMANYAVEIQSLKDEPLSLKTVTADEKCEVSEEGYDDFMSKQGNFEVVGDKTANQNIQRKDEFVDERVRDLIDIMKNNRSLIGLFTTVKR